MVRERWVGWAAWGESFYDSPRGAELCRGSDDYLIVFEEGPNKDPTRPRRTACRREREALKVAMNTFKLPGCENLWGEYFANCYTVPEARKTCDHIMNWANTVTRMSQYLEPPSRDELLRLGTVILGGTRPWHKQCEFGYICTRPGCPMLHTNKLEGASAGVTVVMRAD